jgi:hypothetical protein
MTDATDLLGESPAVGQRHRRPLEALVRTATQVGGCGRHHRWTGAHSDHDGQLVDLAVDDAVQVSEIHAHDEQVVRHAAADPREADLERTEP